MHYKFLHLLCFIGVMTLFTVSATAQCVPNNDPLSGIEPDTLAPAYVGVPYEQIIYFKLPEDTVVELFGFEIALLVDSLVIDSYEGLPPSFSLACNTASCTLLGGQNGCAAITGTATAGEVGIHPLQVFVTTYVSDTFGTSIGGFPDTIDFYFMDVQFATGLQPVNGGTWELGTIFPNPANDQVGVSIHAPVAGSVELVLLDVWGREVIRETHSVNKGVASIWMEVGMLAEGFYFMMLEKEGVRGYGRFEVVRF